MPDYNLGTARGRIVTEYDGRGVAEARTDIRGLTTEAKKSRRGFEEVATGAGIATVAIAAGLGYAANKAIQFEKQISAIGAVSGATKDELELLRKKALELGANTSFSASEAAAGMEELAKAGISTTDILSGAADAAVALAAAGGVELATAAEIAANAMGQFNLKASELGHVADFIAGAANASAISVTDFNESMKQAGAIANLAGVSFDDLAVSIALMGRNGIKGSDAGTSLKTMLANLQPTTARQIKLAKELNLITADGSNKFFDQQGKLKSLSEVSQILNDSTKNLTAQQKTLALETLFGSDAIRAAAILTKNGAKGFEDMATAMGKVTAADVAAARLDNVSGALEQLKGASETAAISIGTALLPIIRRVAEFLTMLTNKFNNLDPKWQKLIAFALVAVGALTALIAVVAAVGFAIIGIGAAFAGLKAAAIVGGIVAAILAVVAGITLLYKRSESFRNAIGVIFNAIKHHVQETIKIIQPFIAFVRGTLIPMLRDGIKKAIDNLRPAFEAVSAFVKDKIVPALATFRASLASAMPTIIKIAQFLGQVLVGAWNAVTKAIAFVVPIILNVAGFIFPLLIKAISFLISQIPTFVSILQTVWNVLKIIGTVIGAVVIGPLLLLWNVAKAVFNGIMYALDFLKAAWGASWAVISLVLSPVVALVKWVMASITSFITAAMNFLSPYIKKTWENIKAFFSIVWTAIVAVAKATWANITNVVKTAVATIKAIIDTIKAIVDKVKSFFGQLKTAAEGGVGKLLEFVKTIPGKVVSALGDLGSLLFDKGKAIVTGFIDGIKSMAGAVGEAAKGLVSKVTDFLPGSPAKKGPLSGQGYAKTRGEHLSQDFSRGILTETDAAERAARTLVTRIAMTVPNTVGLDSTSQAMLRAAVPGLANGTPDIPVAGGDGGSLSIDNVHITGVWDFNDPLVARKIAKVLDEVLTNYKKGYR